MASSRKYDQAHRVPNTKKVPGKLASLFLISSTLYACHTFPPNTQALEANFLFLFLFLNNILSML